MSLRPLLAVLCLLATSLAVPSISWATSTGTSGWAWGSPSPTGADLLDIGFSGSTGYAVGESGTMLKTTDGGATWTGLRTGVAGQLLEVQVVSPELVVTGGGCSALLSSNGGASFTRLYFTSTKCSQQLTGFSFLSATTGYLLLQNGTVLSTTDGGTTWTPKTQIPGAAPGNGSGFAAGIVFTSPTTGVALQTGTGGTKLFRTTDGGGSWTQVLAVQQISDVTFVDANNGFAVGNSGIYATTDGGVTWTQRNTNPNAQSVAAFSPTQAIFVAPNSGEGASVLTTADGGTTLSNTVNVAVNPQAAGYASATRVLLVGAGFGGVAVSNDGGATFPASAGGDTITTTLGRLRAAPGGALATGQSGAYARSTDGGQAWTQSSVPTSESLNDIAFPSAQIGYALDSDGKFFKTTNGGTSWASLDTGTTARPSTLAAASTSAVMLVGPTGVRRTTNGGSAFSTVKGNISKAKLQEWDKGGSAWFVWGVSSTLWRSTNNGSSWSKVALPKKVKISQADFASSSTGYLRDTGGRIWRTSNTGKSWSVMAGTGTSRTTGMSFSSTSTGFLIMSRFGQASDAGYVLRTTDSGKTWNPQLVWNDPFNQYGILAGSTSYGLLGGSDIVYTTNGGVSGTASTAILKPSKTKLKKKAKIQVTITVKGARQGDVAVVSALASGASVWQQQQVTLDSSGKATTSWTVSKTTTFVGQWAGNESHAGDGSPATKVTVG
jgi:photosystem II stability/assembly factor-like uncharacterized protein